MLPAQYRMTRSAEFGATVKQGVRAVQPDIVVHARVVTTRPAAQVREIGLVVGKSVGTAVQRHRVARRLRHVARTVVDELDSGERVVIRALPGSRYAISARLEQQLRTGLRRTHDAMRPADDAPRLERGSGTRGLAVRAVVFLVQLYRNTVSPLRLPTCRFTPTCSEYAVDALTDFGLIRGAG